MKDSDVLLAHSPSLWLFSLALLKRVAICELLSGEADVTKNRGWSLDQQRVRS